ncbi:MAG: hypothetical protein IJS28_05775 [Synergistaceae bacterium]|nr:hypothetical protein [Synergistaceae bacterium]
MNAFLASCGVASRRKAENVILSGRVQVNGKTVPAPFFQAGSFRRMARQGAIYRRTGHHEA